VTAIKAAFQQIIPDLREKLVDKESVHSLFQNSNIIAMSHLYATAASSHHRPSGCFKACISLFK